MKDYESTFECVSIWHKKFHLSFNRTHKVDIKGIRRFFMIEKLKFMRPRKISYSFRNHAVTQHRMVFIRFLSRLNKPLCNSYLNWTSCAQMYWCQSLESKETASLFTLSKNVSIFIALHDKVRTLITHFYTLCFRRKY